jgi:hypothetical protein
MRSGWQEQLTDVVARKIQEYGIEVKMLSMGSNDDDLGRISGSTIEVVVDPLETIIGTFTLCHLFGHMVQFTTMGRYKHLTDAVSQGPPVILSEGFWREFYAYEREAFGYGALLLDKAIAVVWVGSGLRNRYANFMEVDFQHFRDYMTGKKRLDRGKYREKFLHRCISHPAATPIRPLPISDVVWSKLEGVEATIY